MNKKMFFMLLFIYLAILSGCVSVNNEQPDAQVSPFPQVLVETTRPTSSPILILENTPGPTDEEFMPALFSLARERQRVLDEYEELYSAFQQKLKTTGWIRQVSVNRTFNMSTQTYQDWGIFEEWYRLDNEGKFIEGYNWVSAADGTVEQASYFQDGVYYNITSGVSSHEEMKGPIDFSGGFADNLRRGRNILQDRVTYQGKEAWKFSYEISDGDFDFLNVLYFDYANGFILGKETYLLEEDGDTTLVSSHFINSFEINADPPLDHFERILDGIEE